MRTIRILSLIAVVLIAGLAWPASVSSADDLLMPAETRAAAPRLTLRDLNGRRRQLADLKGKAVVVNFWATWCGPCKAEMPEFTRVHAEYRDRGVEFIGAANETRAEKKKVQDFVSHLGIGFPIWLEASLDHLEAFEVGPGIPATVIVDQQGRVAARIQGVTDAAQLRSVLDRLLAETPATPAKGR